MATIHHAADASTDDASGANDDRTDRPDREEALAAVQKTGRNPFEAIEAGCATAKELRALFETSK